MNNALADLEPGDVPVWEPTENSKMEAHGLGDGAGPTIFIVEAFTDDGVPAGMYELKLVGATDAAFYVAPLDHANKRRVHDEAIRAIEASGGTVVNDKTEVGL